MIIYIYYYLRFKFQVKRFRCRCVRLVGDDYEILGLKLLGVIWDVSAIWLRGVISGCGSG